MKKLILHQGKLIHPKSGPRIVRAKKSLDIKEESPAEKIVVTQELWNDIKSWSDKEPVQNF